MTSSLASRLGLLLTGGLLASAVWFLGAKSGWIEVSRADVGDGAWSREDQDRIATLLPAGMDNYVEAAAPGAAHEALARLEGSFRADVLFSDQAGHEPDRLAGRAVNRMAAGGLFLETRYSGRFFDQDFEGVGLIGYDNAAGRYNGLWVDSMGSYLVAFKDSGESTPQRIVFGAEVVDPVGGHVEERRREITVTDADHWRMEEWLLGEGEAKVLDVQFTRTSAAP